MAEKPNKQVFISYSTKDTTKAHAILAALEGAGIGCWIAPRDLTAGTQWGGGIVEALQACKAVLVVFSSASNDSPQVAREMEIAVSNRRPLIPVRVENAMPTQDMQFFLGVSHWFDAYQKPIETYLPEIVAATRSVLAGESKPWLKFRKLARKPWVVPLAVAAVLIPLAFVIMPPKNPADAFKIPFEGRWKTEVKTAAGGKADCFLDVKEMGQASYSEDCPPPIQGAMGSLAWVKAGTWAPNLFHDGDDTGTFLFQGGSAHGYAAAFRSGGSRLRTRDASLGELEWRKVSGGKPLQSAADDILPKTATWPLQDTPATARRALAYARGHWKPDAVLMSIDAKLTEGTTGGAPGLQTPDGAIDLSFRFYSPASQQGLSLSPGSSAGLLFPLGSVDWNANQAAPDDFLDLAPAVEKAHAAGMRGKVIKEAQLDWSSGPACGTGNFAIDNAILPKCPAGRRPFNGLQWMIDSGLNERYWVPATN